MCCDSHLSFSTISTYRSDWSCGYCDTVVSFGAIDDVMGTLERQIGDVSESGKHGIAELEELLFHYSDLLHPNHYILASAVTHLFNEGVVYRVTILSMKPPVDLVPTFLASGGPLL